MWGLLVIDILPRVIWKQDIGITIGLDVGNAADAVHTALIAVHAEYSVNTNVISVTVFFEDRSDFLLVFHSKGENERLMD